MAIRTADTNLYNIAEIIVTRSIDSIIKYLGRKNRLIRKVQENTS